MFKFPECLEQIETLVSQRLLLSLSVFYGIGAISSRHYAAVGCAIATILLLVCLFRKGSRYQIPVCLTSMVIGCGKGWLTWNPGLNDPIWIADGRQVTISARVTEEFRHTDSATLILDGKVTSSSSQGSYYGRVAVTLRGYRLPDPGDIVTCTGRLKVPTPARNEGGFDYAEFLEIQGARTELKLARHADIIVTPTSEIASPIYRLTNRLRQFCSNALQGSVNSTDSAILTGVIFGSKNGMPDELQNAFAATGTVHVLATAGLHVGIFAGTLTWILTRLRTPILIRSCIVIICLLIFVVIAGGRPAVTRAAIMSITAIIGTMVRRESDPLTLLGLASLIILWSNPADIYDPGFQMTFATVAVLIGFQRPMRQLQTVLKNQISKKNPHHPEFLTELYTGIVGLAAVSVAAQIGNSPITAQYFHQISLSGIVANLFVVPIISLIFIGGIFIIVAATVSLPLASFIGTSCVSPVCHYLVGMVTWFSTRPLSSLSIPSPGWLILTTYYCFIGFVAFKVHQWTKSSQRVLNP